jgi:hypothetical protein
MKWLGIVPALLFVAFVIKCTTDEESAGPSAPPPAPTSDLSASIQFTGTQFVVRNTDSLRWTECKFEVNDDYSYALGAIPSTKGAVVGAMQLTKDDGTRFNPFSTAPKRAYLVCMTPTGRRHYIAAWRQ